MAAAATVIDRLGPGFTLADVADEAGVVPGTVAHRFGSKHGLLLAMTEESAASAQRRMRTATMDGEAPVAAITRVLIELYAGLDDPATARNNLAQLAVDLTDEELRDKLAERHAVVQRELRRLVRRAAEAGQLPHAPPPATAARILSTLVDGTALHWSVRPRGSLRRRMRDDLAAVLTGWGSSDNDMRRVR